MYVTYEDLFQLGTFIVALIGLCYTIFKGSTRKSSRFAAVVLRTL